MTVHPRHRGFPCSISSILRLYTDLWDKNSANPFVDSRFLPASARMTEDDGMVPPFVIPAKAGI